MRMGTRDREKELAMLEKALVERSLSMDVRADPLFDPVRSEPRFKQAMAGMGLQ